MLVWICKEINNFIVIKFKNIFIINIKFGYNVWYFCIWVRWLKELFVSCCFEIEYIDFKYLSGFNFMVLKFYDFVKRINMLKELMNFVFIWK